MSTITIGSQTLKTLLTHTVYAAARDDSRPVLAGVHFRVTTTEEGEATLHCETTDGFRLAVASAPCTVSNLTNDKAIVPQEMAKAIVNQIGKHDEPTTLTTFTASERNPASVGGGNTAVWFTVESTHLSLSSRLIDGTYPEVPQLIPKEHVTEVGVKRDALLAAVKRCDIFAYQNNDVLKLTMRDDEDEPFLTLSANAEGVGDATEQISEGIMSGTANVIAFNSGYVKDVLTNMTGDGVTFRMKGCNNAGVFVPHTEYPIEAVAVIMPMHLAA